MEMKSLILSLLPLLIFINGVGKQKIDQNKLKTAKYVIEAIAKNDYMEVLAYFPDQVAKRIPESELRRSVENGYMFIKEFGVPNESELIVSKDVTNINLMSPSGTQRLYSITFPFPPEKKKKVKPKRIIRVVFSNKYGDSKIASLAIKEN